MSSKTNKIKKAAAGILAAAVVACGMPALNGVVPEMGITAYASERTETLRSGRTTAGPISTDLFDIISNLYVTGNGKISASSIY